MRILVQKFGGTSVANSVKILGAARRAIAAQDAGYQVVVVVSARGKKTDELISLATEISDTLSPREMDVLLATGEQESMALTALAIQSLGRTAVSLTGQQLGIRTDGSHSKARIQQITTTRILQHLERGEIVVAAGFQGFDERGDITTLGRGGSDTTATALAAALEAELCEIYTDVEGVFTTDPRLVSTARKIPQISYDEMLELASLGAGVMHSRSIEFAKKFDVALRVRPSFSDDVGTLIARTSAEESAAVTGVAVVKNEVRVSCRQVPDKPGTLAAIFSSMAQARIAIDLVVQNVGADGRAEISFTVPQNELADALTAANAAIAKLGSGTVTTGTNVAKVSVVGGGMPTHSGVAAQLFRALEAAGINVAMITTSEIKISVLINRDRCEEAVRVAHEGFELHNTAAARPAVGREVSRRPNGRGTPPPAAVNLQVSSMEDIVVSEIEVDTNQARVTVRHLPDQPGVCAALFTAVADAGVIVDVIVQDSGESGEAHISFTCVEDQREEAVQVVERITGQWSGVAISSDAAIAKISVVGIGVRSHTGVGERMFRALYEAAVNVELVGTSEMRMSAIVRQSDADRAETGLRQAFALA